MVDIFDDRLGEGLCAEQTREALEDGPLRYESRVPPGYKDANDKSKSGINRYGDLILWYEILDKARKTRKPVLFITDDRKEDWWQKVDGKTVGPRPELANEVRREAGVLFHMLKPLDFLKWAGPKMNRELTEEAAGEIEELRPIEESTVDYGELWRSIASWLASANVKTGSEDSPRWVWEERNPYRWPGYGSEPSSGWAPGPSDLYRLRHQLDRLGEPMGGGGQAPDDRKGNFLDLLSWVLRNMPENVDATDSGEHGGDQPEKGPDEDKPGKELENNEG